MHIQSYSQKSLKLCGVENTRGKIYNNKQLSFLWEESLMVEIVHEWWLKKFKGRDVTMDSPTAQAEICKFVFENKEAILKELGKDTTCEIIGRAVLNEITSQET